MKRVLALTVLAVALSASAAEAHLGNSNYRDTLDHVTPSVPGLSVQVLNYDNDLEVDNATGKTVVIDGYSHEPYAQLLGNGTVQVNHNSPAYYLNQDRDATTPVPASANAKATPQWVTIDKTGRFEWHDHRIHLFTTAIPTQVKDKSKTTKIFPWTVPISVAGQTGAIAGTLFWHGQSNGFPIWALISMLVVVLGGALIVARSKRRARAEEAGEAGEADAPPPSDSPPPKVREAW
jgi:hypothetical protein